MRIVTDIVVHCAATPNGKPFHASDIDKWHVERGFTRTELWKRKQNPNLRAIGYHYVICVDGTEETGRHEDEVGAHCVPNSRSIGICLIGTDKFKQAQFDTLKERLATLLKKYPGAKITGHYQWNSAKSQGKTCPNIDIPAYIVDFIPDDKNILD